MVAWTTVRSASQLRCPKIFKFSKIWNFCPKSFHFFKKTKKAKKFILSKGTKPGFMGIFSLLIPFEKNKFVFCSNLRGLHNCDADQTVTFSSDIKSTVRSRYKRQNCWVSLSLIEPPLVKNVSQNFFRSFEMLSKEAIKFHTLTNSYKGRSSN